MNLYHYTTFTNFCSIWIQRKLKFSEWTNCNDIYEREKIYRFTRQSLEYNGKIIPSEVFKHFQDGVFEEVKKYKQISFCLDDEDCKGYASPMMWGHYARDYQRSGVCIELDSTKVTFPETVYKKEVSYSKDLQPTFVGGVDAEKDDAAQMFVIENRDSLFFIKHWHWKFENEFRLISKDCKELDISGAITSVYILGDDEITLQSIRRIVGDTKMINGLSVGGGNGLQLQIINLYEYDEMQELMRNYKW